MQVHSCQNASASGGLRPPDPLPGLRPWTPLGDFRPPDPLICTPNIYLLSGSAPGPSPPAKILAPLQILVKNACPGPPATGSRSKKKIQYRNEE